MTRKEKETSKVIQVWPRTSEAKMIVRSVFGYIFLCGGIILISRLLWINLLSVEKMPAETNGDYVRLAARVLLNSVVFLFGLSIIRVGNIMVIPSEWIRDIKDYQRLVFPRRKKAPFFGAWRTKRFIDSLVFVIEKIQRLAEVQGNAKKKKNRWPKKSKGRG